MPDFNRVRTRTDDTARWYHSILFGFNNSLRNRRNSVRIGTDTTYTVAGGDTTVVTAPRWRRDVNQTLSNVFNLSAPQNLMGWLKIRPQARYTRSWIQMTGRTFEDKEEHSLGMSANTTLYGLFQPRIGRLTAIRHVVTPLVSFTQSGPVNIRKAVRFSLDNILQAKTEKRWQGEEVQPDVRPLFGILQLPGQATSSVRPRHHRAHSEPPAECECDAEPRFFTIRSQPDTGGRGWNASWSTRP